MIASLRKADILLFFSFLALAALIAVLPLMRSSGGEQKVRIISGGEPYRGDHTDGRDYCLPAQLSDRRDYRQPGRR